MREKRAYQAVRKVAKAHGLPEETIISEIEKAVDMAWKEAYARGDDRMLRRWAEIPCRGKKPTALELIAHLGENLRDRL